MGRRGALCNVAGKITLVNSLCHLPRENTKTRKKILNLANCCLFMLFKVPKLLAEECYLGYYLGRHTVLSIIIDGSHVTKRVQCSD